jgi:hypothetical protein
MVLLSLPDLTLANGGCFRQQHMAQQQNKGHPNERFGVRRSGSYN